jgi:hypothetical protein
MIQVAPEVERLIPVRQTSRSSTAFSIFPSPLDISSLHRLIETYTRILVQVERKSEDENGGQKTAPNRNDLAATGMGDSGYSATTNGPAKL